MSTGSWQKPDCGNSNPQPNSGLNLFEGMCENPHALARQVYFGKQGRITVRDLEEQKNSASCLTLVLACLIYWQAKEINRVILECDPEGAGIDLSLIEHISPIGWENVILYGEYVLNRGLVRI